MVAVDTASMVAIDTAIIQHLYKATAEAPVSKPHFKGSPGARVCSPTSSPCPTECSTAPGTLESRTFEPCEESSDCGDDNRSDLPESTGIFQALMATEVPLHQFNTATRAMAEEEESQIDVQGWTEVGRRLDRALRHVCCSDDSDDDCAHGCIASIHSDAATASVRPAEESQINIPAWAGVGQRLGRGFRRLSDDTD